MKTQLENLTLQMYKSGLRYSEGLREFQKVFVLTVLREHKWNQFQAAKKLGMHRNTLRRLLRDFQLDIKSLRAAARRRPPDTARPLLLEKKERAR
ncbi:MAG: histidine kinase [Acidobacteriia bacterium]|nr:histidine kinase [Terriglobia bacterium]